MTTPGNGDGPGPAGPAADDLLAPAPGLPVLNAAYTVRPRRRVFPGRPDQVRHARRFVERALDGCPVTDTAVLLTSELASNAVQHTATRDGGSFEVIACRALAAAAVAVIDDGAATTPAPREARPGDLNERGHGLELVDMLATQWGHWGHWECAQPGEPGPNGAGSKAVRRLVWFRLDWDAA